MRLSLDWRAAIKGEAEQEPPLAASRYARGMNNRILLLHGIWNAKSWLAPLARRLRAEGFEVDVFGYPSVFGGSEVAIARLIEQLSASKPVNLVR